MNLSLRTQRSAPAPAWAPNPRAADGSEAWWPAPTQPLYQFAPLPGQTLTVAVWHILHTLQHRQEGVQGVRVEDAQRVMDELDPMAAGCLYDQAVCVAAAPRAARTSTGALVDVMAHGCQVELTCPVLAPGVIRLTGTHLALVSMPFTHHLVAINPDPHWVRDTPTPPTDGLDDWPAGLCDAREVWLAPLDGKHLFGRADAWVAGPAGLPLRLYACGRLWWPGEVRHASPYGTAH